MHKVIRDPVHNLITLSGDEGRVILELIDRPEFQRLRRIRQLGLGLLAYPGAEHSRFSHSLGVFHVARRMLDALRLHYTDRSEEYKELEKYRKEILVAALLHDVGHGPFSHLFEQALPWGESHEQWSVRIIQESFAPMLEKLGVDMSVVAGLISKTSRENLLAKDIISSQLDADRMDYLLRDSLAAGPKYGHFDLEWLLHSLRIGKVPVAGQKEGTWRLCFDSDKAIHVVEEYIQAREFMYLQVYIHKTTRAYESLLKNILGLVTFICGEDPEKVPKPCPPALAKLLSRKSVSSVEYLSLDDFRLWTTLVDWSQLSSGNDPNLTKLARKCRQLVNREQPYKFVDLDNTKKQEDALALVTKLEESPLRFSCERDAYRDLAYRNARYRKSKDHDEEEDRVIYFIEPNGKPKPAEDLSAVIRAISEIPIEVFRLYYDQADSKVVDRLISDGWKLD